MSGTNTTVEEFFQDYLINQKELASLKYQLSILDDDMIRTTYFKHDLTKGNGKSHLDERICDRVSMKEELILDIQWLEFEINRAERIMSNIGDKDGFRISYLKRYYLDNQSHHKIATSYGISLSKLKRIMKETEELLCLLAR